MTDYYHAWVPFGSGGTGSVGDPFLDPYTARTAMQEASSQHFGHGSYVRLQGSTGRDFAGPSSGTVRNPTMFIRNVNGTPWRWYAGASMVKTTAGGGPTWTETSGGSTVWTCSLGFAFGNSLATNRHLLWFYDTSTPNVAARPLVYAGSDALCDATDNSFYFNPTGNLLRVNLGAGENPDGRIMVPYGSNKFIDGWGDWWTDNWFQGLSNCVFDGFSYLFCGTRPWDYQGAGAGHEVKNVVLRRGWFGFTHAADAVIRPVGRSAGLVIDGCKLECGGIGIVYSYEGAGGAGIVRGKHGHIMHGLRVSGSLLVDAGWTHRGGNDNHAVASQGSASNWEVTGNIITQTGRAVVLWPGNRGGGEVANNITIAGNLISGGVASYGSWYDLSYIHVSWENGDNACDQSGSSVSGNVIDGAVTALSADYGISSAPAAKAIGGIRTGRQLGSNVIPVRGNIVKNASASYIEQQNDADTEIGWDVQACISADLTSINSIAQHIRRENNTGTKSGVLALDHMTFLGAIHSYRLGAIAGVPQIYTSAADVHAAVPAFLTTFYEGGSINFYVLGAGNYFVLGTGNYFGFGA